MVVWCHYNCDTIILYDTITGNYPCDCETLCTNTMFRFMRTVLVQESAQLPSRNKTSSIHSHPDVDRIWNVRDVCSHVRDGFLNLQSSNLLQDAMCVHIRISIHIYIYIYIYISCFSSLVHHHDIRPLSVSIQHYLYHYFSSLTDIIIYVIIDPSIYLSIHLCIHI